MGPDINDSAKTVGQVTRHRLPSKLKAFSRVPTRLATVRNACISGPSVAESRHEMLVEDDHELVGQTKPMAPVATVEL
jgi:hypothetical protein